MQGVRANHEDAHVLDHGLCLAAVFDGHVGDDASVFAAERLPLHLGAQGDCRPDVALQGAFASCEAEMLETFPDGCEAGTTATAAVVRAVGDGDFRIHVANCGDSRALLWRKETGSILATRDHRPDDEDEKSRIEAAGGTVCDDFDPPRIDGALACSRALGSFGYKSGGKDPALQKVSCVPDIYEWEASVGDILLIACDGVFDTISNEKLVAAVCQRDAEGDLGRRLADTLELCIKQDCDDNMTLLAIELGDDVPLVDVTTEVSAGGFAKAKDSEVVEQYVAFCKRFGYGIKKEMQQKGPPLALLEALPPAPGRFAHLPAPQSAPPEEPEKESTAETAGGTVVVKVTVQRPLAVILTAARQLLEGDGEAAPLPSIEVQGLGNAMPKAASVVVALVNEGYQVERMTTDSPAMKPTRRGAGAPEQPVPRLRARITRTR